MVVFFLNQQTMNMMRTEIYNRYHLIAFNIIPLCRLVFIPGLLFTMLNTIKLLKYLVFIKHLKVPDMLCTCITNSKVDFKYIYSS